MKTDNSKPIIDLSSPSPLRTVNQSAAARSLGVNVSNISRILSRSPDPSQRRVPHLHTFYHLARYLGLTLDQLYSLLYPDYDRDSES